MRTNKDDVGISSEVSAEQRGGIFVEQSRQNIHIIGNVYNSEKWKSIFPEYQNSYLVVDDPLTYGELSHTDNLEEWFAVRQRSLQNLFPDDIYYSYSKEVTLNTHILKHADSITLWVGNNLQDQIIIPYIIQLTELLNIQHVPIHLIEFEASPSGRSSAIAILSADELVNHPKPSILSPSVINFYKKAWQALCADTPDKLVALVNDSAYPLLHLQKALASLLCRYPHRETGLLYWDSVLLKNIKQHGPSVLRIVGFSMGHLILETGDEDWISDIYLWKRMQVMASYSTPLLTLRYSNGIHNHSMSNVTATLTAFGEQVANGNQLAYPVCPIDEWIAGVHLSSSEQNLWFYQDKQLYPAL